MSRGTKRSFIQAAGGIDWYCEQSGSGPHVVLVPSGEGDCASFAAVAENLATDFSVLTFDTPGFSRTSDPVDPAAITVDNLPRQIVSLLTSLDITTATFFGCSSGGCAVLNLTTDYPRLVRNAVVHEAAILVAGEPSVGMLMGNLLTLSDAEIVQACEEMFSTLFVESQTAWLALGPDYHARLAKNYVTWVRRYWTAGTARHYEASALRGLPIAWTIGGLSPAMAFLSNVRLALGASLDLDVLICKHFPQVTVPDALSGHIRRKTLEYMA